MFRIIDSIVSFNHKMRCGEQVVQVADLSLVRTFFSFHVKYSAVFHKRKTKSQNEKKKTNNSGDCLTLWL